jgi:hypothetical protein
MTGWSEALKQALALPDSEQGDALRRLAAASAPAAEAWNTTFGPESLYEAWTHLPLMQGLYSENRRILRPFLDARPAWHVVEIGGGNGALWRGFFHPGERGRLTLVDPVPDAHAALAASLPAEITLDSVIAPVEQVQIPEADAIVCSLTLHHVAGIDARQRSEFRFSGPGKVELLGRFVEAIRPVHGIGLLNEADAYHEIDLAPNDPVLVQHFVDVYIRRAALAVADALDRPVDDPSLKARWEAIIRHWCLDQVGQASVPRNERDVYELDVTHWLALVKRAGAEVLAHRYTDAWSLFHQYLFVATPDAAPALPDDALTGS